MFKNLKIISLILLVFMLGFSNNSFAKSKKNKISSPLETPQALIQAGIISYNNNRLDEAFMNFEKAINIDKKNSTAYYWKAKVYFVYKDFDNASKYYKKSIHYNRKNNLAYLGRAEVYLATGNLKKAFKYIRKVLKRDEKNFDALYLMAKAYQQKGDFDRAEKFYKKALEIQPDNEKANASLQILLNLSKASAGNNIYSSISLKKQITRAEFAALIVLQFKLNPLTTPSKAQPDFLPPSSFESETQNKEPVIPDINDISNHWAKTFIIQAVQAGVMQLDTKNKFYPDNKLTRIETAQILLQLTENILKQQTLSKEYYNIPSRIKDIPSSHFAYPAVCFVIDRGIMQPQINAEFNGSDPVSGTDAILFLRNIKILINQINK